MTGKVGCASTTLPLGRLLRRAVGAAVGTAVMDLGEVDVGFLLAIAEGEVVEAALEGTAVGARVEGFIELGKADNLRGALVTRFTGALVGARVFEGEAVGDELDGLCVGALVGFTEERIGVFEGVATGTRLGAGTGPLVIVGEAVLGDLVADSSTCANLRVDCKK